ncbi:hypothetical protein GCM10009678_49690 [Actinomadura kijaniata]|uniref:Uncharacterized protein n=1 Tax=Actinomadura namibiensis TaxID=182080 RepID=A0A7W3QM17_ACTNM|nr:hypothetical protein [Actinomadura namibiensis]MBA8951553.1 hypothetical protein [Actinomadura namibiensis]
MDCARERAVPLPLSGCLVRLGTGSRRRAALEIYVGPGGLFDVVLADVFGARPLRAAVRGGGARDGWSLAWGHLLGPAAPAVTFGSRRAAVRAPVAVVADAFWVAEVPGRHRRVQVTCADASDTGRLHRIRNASAPAGPTA